MSEENSDLRILFRTETRKTGTAISSPTVSFYNTKPLSRFERFVWKLKFKLGLTDWELVSP